MLTIRFDSLLNIMTQAQKRGKFLGTEIRCLVERLASQKPETSPQGLTCIRKPTSPAEKLGHYLGVEAES
ncbi:hypothetical protein TKWG_20865 [Advenella kashmirensis WT001]|uniref:Uncharacterized protein n=1 Tax=Advenella kashmirensis (strain DSM 17095 / LMG 22695 / WT001) TaxID=1036672 RepID=I3UFV2_ADVKW|nr:hypothetical protein TKWG_20865 [Advenella kashmirensis WT001]